MLAPNLLHLYILISCQLISFAKAANKCNNTNSTKNFGKLHFTSNTIYSHYPFSFDSVAPRGAFFKNPGGKEGSSKIDHPQFASAQHSNNTNLLALNIRSNLSFPVKNKEYKRDYLTRGNTIFTQTEQNKTLPNSISKISNVAITDAGSYSNKKMEISHVVFSRDLLISPTSYEGKPRQLTNSKIPYYTYLPHNKEPISMLQAKKNTGVITTANRFLSPPPIYVHKVYLDDVAIAKTDLFEVANSIKNICITIRFLKNDNIETGKLEYCILKKSSASENKHWIPLNNAGTINLFSPEHCTYKVTLRKRQPMPENDYAFKTIHFTVLPNMYETTTFIYSLVLGTLAILLFAFLIFKNYYSNRNRLITEKAMIATSQLHELNITLDQKITEQKKITRAVLKAEEREKNKIGQELHDNVNQVLAAIKLQLGNAILEKQMKEMAISNTMQLVDNVINEIRYLSKDKVSPIKKTNLQEMLEELIDSMTISNQNNLTATLVYKGKKQEMEYDLKLNIYRIVQEQLTNIIKHAMAANVFISVKADSDYLFLSVCDDGKGFDPKTKLKGIGISNMINRVESFNGTIKINSSLSKGTKIHITLPLTC